MHFPTDIDSLPSCSAPVSHSVAALNLVSRLNPHRSANTCTFGVYSTHLGCANDSCFSPLLQQRNVRILRRDQRDYTRLVMSGRMADVCAALDRMSREEAISAVQ